eukprot:scaffold4387_cov400-Prasinococcus_capsulatus_cf.AAC.10
MPGSPYHVSTKHARRGCPSYCRTSRKLPVPAAPAQPHDVRSQPPTVAGKQPRHKPPRMHPRCVIPAAIDARTQTTSGVYAVALQSEPGHVSHGARRGACWVVRVVRHAVRIPDEEGSRPRATASPDWRRLARFR